MAVAVPDKQESIARNARATKLRDYVSRAAADELVASELADAALRVWECLARSCDRLPVPDACPTAEGSLMFTWDRAEHHLELEFTANEPPMFFYANRKSGALWEAAYSAKLHSEALQKLALVSDPE